ncbi:MAG: cytochrome ubiquinol oxidase subunit I [Bacteroidales bacterium]|nr:cytochrome ubiquinol oxidase subunit I [Bacteroidales bacterium]MDZ4204712.1 cytochrome ubiquinol oxidase subunit I [Bacteroidales bacterium]
MTETFDFALVNWSRGLFALTAMYHWLFVPLTLGLAYIMAIMETIYVKTGDPHWKKTTKFWMTLFGINFAIGIATGLILEFEFGTNWSNYSWFVGDIFGAPLAIEGIFAFFIESTFIAVMYFGWNKVSKKFHLLSTWLVAFGASLSALWILVANAWMQDPVGMLFNPDTARNEMGNFWEVFLSPMAINKFLHTISSAYLLASVFVIGVSAWYLLKKREVLLAKRSILVAAVFGIITAGYTIVTGDGSASLVAKNQPMKFAAFEGLYHGKTGAGLVAVGVLSQTPEDPNYEDLKEFYFKIEIPNLLSYLAFRDFNAFVPGVRDLLEGNEEHGIMAATEKIKRGKIAINALAAYQHAKEAGDNEKAAEARRVLDENFQYFGYGYFDDPKELVPSIPITFYSFHLMVALGFYFFLLMIIFLWLLYKDRLEKAKTLLRIAIFSIPLAYIASQSGWITAEVGRQPWVIQDLLPTMVAVSHINATTVQVTFWLFAVLFTTLMIAEIRIMTKQIKLGPKDEGGK